MTPFDPSSWFGSPQGREAIERGAARVLPRVALRCSTYGNYGSCATCNEAAEHEARATLSALLSDRLCDTCGGDGEIDAGSTYDEPWPAMFPCPDCVNGRRPSVLVPRTESGEG